MRIAVNTRFLLSSKMEGFGWYTYEIVKRMVQEHPEHTFIFFFDRPYDEKFIFGENVIPVVLKPQARHPILFKIWFNRSVTKALKKYHADVFFSPDGYLSLKTTVKQIAVIHDINFEHFPEDIPRSSRNYLRTFFPLFAKKAQQIITVSQYSKDDIEKTYHIPTDKINVVWNGASEVFKPVSQEEASAIRSVYTGGKPYLLFVGALHPRKNVNRLIEAFQLMKTANPSNQYQLLIVGEAMFSNKDEQLGISEGFKSEVHFTGHLALNDLAQVMAAASVFTFVPYFEGFGIPLVEAMKSGTPILSGNRTSLPEVAGDAALFCDPFNTEDIADKMITICNNENLRKELSKKGIERGKLFSWDKAAQEAWKIIEKTLNTK